MLTSCSEPLNSGANFAPVALNAYFCARSDVGGGSHLAGAASRADGERSVRAGERHDIGKVRDRASLLHNGFPLLLAIGVIDSATRMGFLTFLPFFPAGGAAGRRRHRQEMPPPQASQQ